MLFANRNLLLNNRAVFNTCAATGTAVFDNCASFLLDFNFEIPSRSFNAFKICVCDEFDI
jgi:hypothetical protein